MPVSLWLLVMSARRVFPVPTRIDPLRGRAVSRGGRTGRESGPSTLNLPDCSGAVVSVSASAQSSIVES